MPCRVIVLGSGQDAGSPQFGSRRREPGGHRFASSVCVVSDDGRALLVDATPDLKAQEQLLLDDAAYASRRRPGPFDGIVLTHAHMGHYAGLVHFGREALDADRVPCWVTPRMARFLRRNAPWSQLVGLGNIDLREVEPGGEFAPWPGLGVRLVPVPHRDEFSDTVAVSIAGEVLYLPDIDGWAEWPQARRELERHSVALVDATFYSAGEVPHRDLSEIKHPFVPDTVERFADLASTRIVLSHLNHTNPIADATSVERRRVDAAGFEVAVEGMVIEVSAGTS